MDGEPRRLPAVDDHPLRPHLTGSLLGHDRELAPSTEQREIAFAKLAGGDAENEIDESALLGLSESIRRPQPLFPHAVGRYIRGDEGFSASHARELRRFPPGSKVFSFGRVRP